jgi:Tol biopolymer transport system component/serine/threonine protein kinase
MNPEDWSRIEPLLDQLLDLEPPDRQARLAALAADDAVLAARLRSLLTTSTGPEEDLLSRPLDDVVSLLLHEHVIPSRVGERVGPFRITAQIGHGGMGAVYEAERVEGGFAQHVAVKVLKRGLDSEQVVRRFLAERQILARLDHPHIARLMDGGITTDGLPWFAMERVDGRPLTEDVAERARSLPECLELLLEVCDAVAFAHTQRIVHRDLKPSNVLVDARGQVKLLDFGIAKLLDSTEEKLTRTDMVVMTPSYAAPEQLGGLPVTTATDVWQLGRLMTEVLPRPLPRDLERILARASHEEPERRYPAADALSSDLRRFLAGQPILARGDSLAYRTARWAVRRRRDLAIASVAIVATLGLALVFWRVGTRGGPSGGPLPFFEEPLRFHRVSTFPGSHRQASFSPDGRSIAFVTEDATGAPQVWTKDLEGADPVQRTRDTRGAHRPRWSPRGDQIVYDVPGQGIWSVPPFGGTARQLTSQGFNANLSPDGGQLVYEVDAFLWTARADGTGSRRIAGGGGNAVEKEYAFVESAPAFSPDGREVVYFQDHDTPIAGDLWTVPISGGAPRRRTSDDVTTSHPVWMPDGSGIVYSSARRGGLTLWFVPSGGSEPQPLTTGTGEDTEAAISRDGRRLIYTNARNLLRLMWLDPRTGVRRQLLENRSVLTHPSFSPDGNRLAVFQGEGRHSIHLWTLRTDGSDLRQLTGPPSNEVLPNWSADGRTIFHYRLPPNPGFLQVPAEGGPAEMIVPGWRFTTQHGAHVSPDKRSVAYTVLEHGSLRESRVRDLQTGAERPLAQPILWPRWSPEGTLLAGRNRERQLVLCPSSGAACRRLGVEGSEPRWSRDGRQIYFVRYAGYHGSRDPRVVPLWKVGVDGSAPTHVADLDGPSPLHFFYDVSPTGEIAWASFVAGRQELWLADLPPRR